MAVGLSSAAALTLLTSLKGSYTYVQLHTADPGAAGTTAVADETTRKLVTWPTSVTSQPMSNTNALTWTAVTVTGGGTQDYTHFSAWSASTSGAFGFSGTITANPVSSGDQFEIPINDLDVSLPVAA